MTRGVCPSPKGVPTTSTIALTSENFNETINSDKIVLGGFLAKLVQPLPPVRPDLRSCFRASRRCYFRQG